MSTRRCPFCDELLTSQEEEDRYCNSCKRYLPFDDRSVLRPRARRDQWREEEETGDDRDRDRRGSRVNTQTPAIWLRVSAVMEFLLSTCCLLTGCVVAAFPDALQQHMGEDDKLAAVVVGGLIFGGAVVIIGLGIVVVLGARALSTRKKYGLALAGAIIALVLGLKCLVQLGLGGLGLLGALEERQERVVIVGSCGILVVTLAAAIVDLIAGIWALVVLSKEGVRDTFR